MARMCNEDVLKKMG